MLVRATNGFRFRRLIGWFQDRRHLFSYSRSLIVIVATLVSGLVPAFVSSGRTAAAEMMKEGGRGNSSRWSISLPAFWWSGRLH